MEHTIPTFTPGPVTKEILQCLRDLSYDEQTLRYNTYTDGIITGCTLIEENMRIGLVNGIVKFAGRLYKLKEKILIPYEPTDALTIMKLRFSPQIPSRDFIHYKAELVLDTDPTLKPHEMEMGRFKLKRGSRLRTTYKDFRDMATEYDTVNLMYLKQSAPGDTTLSPTITRLFGHEAYPHIKDNALDAAFCTQALASGEAINRELIEHYVCNRLSRTYTGKMDNARLHASLGEVLNLITGHTPIDKGRGHGDGILLLN